MTRDSSFLVRVLPRGYVVTVDGEELAAFSHAAELAAWIEDELTQLEPPRSAEPLPAVLDHPRPPATVRRLFKR